MTKIEGDEQRMVCAQLSCGDPQVISLLQPPGNTSSTLFTLGVSVEPISGLLQAKYNFFVIILKKINMCDRISCNASKKVISPPPRGQ